MTINNGRDQKPGQHGSTFGGNPIGCKKFAIAALEVVQIKFSSKMQEGFERFFEISGIIG